MTARKRPKAAESGSLSARQEALALALASGLTARDACGRAGVAERTARTWQADPTFSGRVRQLRTDLFSEAVGRLAGQAAAAADALAALLKNKDPKVRLAAAKALLDLGPQLHEHVELAAAVDELRRWRLEVEGNGDGNTGPRGSPAAGGARGPEAGGGGDAAGPAAPGPGGPDDRRGPGRRPLANEPAALPLAADPPALFPSIG